MTGTQIGNWYATLAPRDQRVLQIGAVAVVLILLVAVFLPLHRNLDEAGTELAERQADLDWMRQVAPALTAAGPAPIAPASKESLGVVVDSSAREAGLGKSLTASNQTAAGGLRLQLDNAEFNAMAAWLARLSSQHGIHIESASITSTKSPGLVNATVQLSAR